MGAPKGNNYSPGRPNKYNSVEEMQAVIDKYFDDCDKNNLPYTVSELALALDLTRQGLVEYGNKERFSDAVKRAKLRVEAYAERCLYSKQNPAGVIFSLKNNYGWKDKQEIDATVNVNMSEAIQAARQRAKQIDS